MERKYNKKKILIIEESSLLTRLFIKKFGLKKSILEIIPYNGKLLPLISITLNYITKRYQRIIFTYNRSQSFFYYLKIFSLLYLLKLIGNKVFYFTKRGILKPVIFPFFNIIILIKQFPQIISKLIKCIFSSSKNVIGFNKFFSTFTLWYNVEGNNLLRYGCWGYVFTENFGVSYKEKFYLHYLSYGLLFNKLEFKKYVILSILLFIISFLVVFIISDKLLFALLIIPFLVISPFFVFSFFYYTKPEILGWFLALPILYCTVKGYIVPLAFLLLLATYISFTVFFISAFIMISLVIFLNNFIILISFLPSVVKLGIDFFQFLKGFGLRRLLHIISGIGGDPRNKRKYGIYKFPRIFLLWGMLIILNVLLLYFKIYLSFVVMFSVVLLIFINFQVIRFADDHTFYRVILIALLFNLLFSNNYISVGITLLFLLINPQIIDNYDLLEKNGEVDIKTYPPVEIVKMSGGKIKELEKFLSKIKPNSRVLFEYSGPVRDSKFRVIFFLTEFMLYKRNIEFIPNEFLPYTNPEFFYNIISNLSPKGNLNIIDKMSSKCSINYFLIFSKELVIRLLKRDYKILGVYNLNKLRNTILLDFLIPNKKIYLMYKDKSFNYTNALYITMKKYPNKIILKNVKKNKIYILHYKYHPDWKAVQGEKSLKIEPTKVICLDFMKLKSKNSKDIIIKFGKCNYYIR